MKSKGLSWYDVVNGISVLATKIAVVKLSLVQRIERRLLLL